VSPSRGTPRWSLRIAPDLKRKLKAKAAREGRTMTEVVVGWMEEYAEGEE
jgi:predicted DNA-binding protein